MLENIEINCHSSIKIYGNKIIYIDPFRIKKDEHDADIIFITHSHYDHYSKEDINKIKKEETVIVIPKDMLTQILDDGFRKEKIQVVNPCEEYEVKGIKFSTILAYNIDKQFHPKEKNWIGYLINVEGVIYYIAVDTDITKENRRVRCDIAFVPVGGTYTMNFKEAAELINEIKPKVAIPIHYGEIVGTQSDALSFQKLLRNGIKSILKIKL